MRPNIIIIGVVVGVLGFLIGEAHGNRSNWERQIELNDIIVEYISQNRN